MLMRLALKELREAAWLVVAAGVVYAYQVMLAIGFGRTELSAMHSSNPVMTCPFRPDVAVYFVLVGMCLAAGLGLRQTVGESARGTFPFLLNRPVSRRWLIGTKLLVGLGLYLVVSALPLAIYAWWAATPGTHASPFTWWMASTAWMGWLAGSVVYLGAFLAGLRPGRWHGTRLLPLVAALAAAIALPLAPWPGLARLSAILLLDVLLATVIAFVAQTRDYS